ncbi:hypothetical protein CR513_26354, partial [Mucuna pruriens]
MRHYMSTRRGSTSCVQLVLITKSKSNTQKFGVRRFAASKVVNEIVVIDNQGLENKITKLTSLVRQLTIGQHHSSPPVKTAHDQYSNMRYSSHPTQNVPQRYQPPPPFRQQQPMRLIAISNMQFQQNMSTIIQDLQT